MSDVRDIAAGAPTPAEGQSRREFLALVGASFGGLALAGCGLNAPAETILPYIQQPEATTPGLASWYASTCGGCSAGCGALVKVREGRPIKLEGLPEHPLSRGGLCPRGQATVLDLYDSTRLAGPQVAGAAASWAACDAYVRKGLAAAGTTPGAIRLVTRTVISPTLARAIAALQARYPAVEHVVYEPVSLSAILDAHAQTHGVRALPTYQIERAKVLVGIDCDFLGSWMDPVGATRAWARNRRLDPKHPSLSWHGQVEARLSLTGANADARVAVRPSAYAAIARALAGRIAAAIGHPAAATLPTTAPGAIDAAALGVLAERLLGASGRSLVLCGVNDPATQAAVNVCNGLLGNYGTTLHLSPESRQHAADDAAMDRCIDAVAAGAVGAVIFCDANPVYDHPRGAALAAALGRVPTSVALADRLDETAQAVHAVAPIHHALEAWGDAQPTESVAGVQQPVIAPLRDTRAAVESLLQWAGQPASMYDAVRATWRDVIHPQVADAPPFETFWEQLLQAGVVALGRPDRAAPELDEVFVGQLATAALPVAPAGLELVCHGSATLGDGRQANNPWLQELPDPIAKTTWGNHAALSPATAAQLGAVEGRLVTLRAGDVTCTLPAAIQPGQADGVVAVALGYGRTGAGPIAGNYPTEKMLPVPMERPTATGANAYPLVRAASVQVALADGLAPLSRTQKYDSQVEPITGRRRDIVRTTSLAAWLADPAAGNPPAPEAASLWEPYEYTGYKWGMAIDLNACTGCSACAVACQAENNVPVVGPVEVRKHRDMHWIRLDRYYETDADTGALTDVAFQPMLCQHCDNAPCETVCPVLATVHSTEGTNQQVYNRCVGTRYCANNCPYKVRRFNWFDYAHDDPVQNLVLNPDVTVRSRGIMEKCSFCVQRVAEAKGAARGAGRRLTDGDVRPACAQSCPADAIAFGDLNDPRSRVAALAADPRAFVVLDDLGVRPNVHYLTRVRNTEGAG